jgi:ankyrin repeat protein
MGPDAEAGRTTSVRPESALIDAIVQGDDETALAILAQHPRTADYKLRSYPSDDRPTTPLHVAARWGRDHIVASLLELQVQLEAVDGDYDTPLRRAASSGNYHVVKRLLEHGANPNAPGRYGVRPFDMAWRSPELQELVASYGGEAGEKRGKDESVGRSIGDSKLSTFIAFILVLVVIGGVLGVCGESGQEDCWQTPSFDIECDTNGP